MQAGERAMPGRWWDFRGAARPAVSPEFEHALTREVMRTELVRIKALIITSVALVLIVWIVHISDPDVVRRIWRSGVNPAWLYVILIAFILLELSIHALVSRYLELDRDAPPI